MGPVEVVAERFGCSREEAFRRAARLMAELVEWEAGGGQVVLQKRGRRERLRFLSVGEVRGAGS